MKLFRRDSEANVIEMGTVEFIDGKLKFSGFKDSHRRLLTLRQMVRIA